MMKKILCIFLAGLLVLGCCGCTQEEVITDFRNYEYRYNDQRNRAWEEDIVYLADIFLGDEYVDGHPYLTRNQVEVHGADFSKSELRCMYDEEMYNAFVADVSELIRNVPSLSDQEILYELRRIVCALEDCHSYVQMVGTEFFPIAVEPLESGGELGLYVVGLPAEHEELLYSRLVSINDVPVEEVFQKMAPYLDGESPYAALASFANILMGGCIAMKDTLQITGVMDKGSDTAVFHMVTESGEAVDVELEALDTATEEYGSVELVSQHHANMGFLSWSKYMQEDYFFEYLEEEDALYIRLYTVPTAQSGALLGFMSSIKKLVRERGGVSKTIVDFRDNGGGVPGTLRELIEFLNDPVTGHKYVLINESSFSAAVLVPYMIKTGNSDTTLVGTNASQEPNTPSVNGQMWTMPNCGILFRISMGYMELDPDYAYDTLTPDVQVYLNLEDYKQGVDTVLETVLNME